MAETHEAQGQKGIKICLKFKFSNQNFAFKFKAKIILKK